MVEQIYGKLRCGVTILVPIGISRVKPHGKIPLKNPWSSFKTKVAVTPLRVAAISRVAANARCPGGWSAHSLAEA